VPPKSRDLTIGKGDGINPVFESYLETPIVQGSVTVTAMYDMTGSNELVTMVLTDANVGNSGEVGVLVPMNSGHASEGVVDYRSGALSLEWENPPAAGTPITVQYAQTRTTEASTLTITAFTVFHTEGVLELVDNNGDNYTGFIAKPTTAGKPQLTEQEKQEMLNNRATENQIDGGGGGERGQGSDQDIVEKEFGVSYPFEVSGTSGGVGVTITGTIRLTLVVSWFFAERIDENGYSFSLEEVFRTKALNMHGTWIEANGKAAELNAVGPSDVVNEILLEDAFLF
jgi:hypothetical protein